MAKKQTNEIAVGLTVLVALALTIYIVVVLGDWKSFFQAKQQVTVTLPYQEGLKGLIAGSPVYLGGAKIGQIIQTSIDDAPDTNNEVYVYFTMEIPREYRLFRDCRLEAKSNVLGGQASLVIHDLGKKKPQIQGEIPVRLRLEGGLADAMNTVSRELDISEPNSLLNRIRYELDRNADDSVLGSLVVAMDQLRQITTKINEQVTIETDPDKPTLIAKAYQIADNLSGVSRELKEQMDKNDQEALLYKLLNSTDNLVHISHGLKVQLDTQNEEALLAKLHITLDGLQQTNLQVQSLLRSTEGLKSLSNIEDVLAELEDVIYRIRLLIQHQYPNIDLAIRNIVESTDDLKEGLSDVKQQPSKLFFSPPPDELENVK